jgi:hypothetical protein
MAEDKSFVKSFLSRAIRKRIGRALKVFLNHLYKIFRGDGLNVGREAIDYGP